MEDNTSLVSQREQEIAQVVKSIAELNEIFKDLAQIIVDQVNRLNVLRVVAMSMKVSSVVCHQ